MKSRCRGLAGFGSRKTVVCSALTRGAASVGAGVVAEKAGVRNTMAKSKPPQLDPSFTDEANEYGPVGNDTGAHLLGHYRQWRESGNRPGQFLPHLLQTWPLTAIFDCHALYLRFCRASKGSFRCPITTSLLTGTAPANRESESSQLYVRSGRRTRVAPRSLRLSRHEPVARRLAQLLAPLAEKTRPRKLSLSGPSVNWIVAQFRDRRDSSPVATLFEIETENC